MNKPLKLIQKYGFLLVLIYCTGGFEPAFYPKVGMMDLNLNERIDSKSGSNLFKQFFWVFLFFIYSLSFFHEKNRFIDKRRGGSVLFVLSLIIIISFLSMLWSNFPEYVLKRTFFQLFFISVCIFSFYYSFKNGCLEQCVKFCLYYVFFLIIISLIMGWGLTPNMSLAGYEKGKNVLGMNLVVLFIIYNFLCKDEIVKNKIVISCALIFLIVLTQSKTCLLLVFIFLFLINTKQSYVKLVNFISLSVLTVIFIIAPCVSYYANSYLHIGFFVEPEFITGRGYIWDTIYYDLSFYDNIFLGYGYASFFGTPEIPYFFDDTHSFLRFISSSHNGYINLLIQFGVLSILVIMLFGYLGKNINNRYANAAITIIIAHNTTETSFYRDNTVIWLLFLIIVAFSLIRKKEI